jgi:hypothetical protein
MPTDRLRLFLFAATLRPILFAGVLVSCVRAGSIEGRVTNSVTGEPVGGAEVRFLDRHSYVFQTVTDSSGTYRLANLGDGDYSGEFSKDGFPNSPRGPFVTVSGDLAARLDAQLNPFGGLRGRVVDEEGKPAAKVRVEIDKTNDGVQTTDENGEFYFKELRPGSFTIVAKPEPLTRMEGGVKVGTVPVYYPSVTQLADAIPVTVGWGADVAGITIALKNVPVRRVAGLVLDAAGKPVAHAMVRLLGRPGKAKQQFVSAVGGLGSQPFVMGATLGPGPEPELTRVESHEDGSFEFPAVEQGDWRVSAEAGVDDDQPVEGVVSAAVGDKDLENVRIRVSAPFAVPVTGDAQPILQPMEGQHRQNVDPATNVGKINGIFPGRYLVLSLRFGGASYVGAVMLGGIDVLGQEIELEEGSGPLEMVMKHDTGSLRGTVENGEGANVYLVGREPGEVVQYRRTSCGAGGAFQFGDVPPGDYYVAAFDRVQGLGLPPDNLPDSIVPLARSVTIEAGSAASLDLRVGKW